MSNQYSKVIIFGPTGDIGGATALEAGKRGAKVWLAMRNPDKTIDSITKEQEQQGAFSRIQADLSDAESVKKAVQQSGANAAYIYFVPGIKDSIQAMKDAGIEYVVFLSTFSIEPGQDVRQVAQSEVIPYAHAQVEIALEDASIVHTALRPAVFASNALKQNLDKSANPWQAKILDLQLRVDCISPNDIGRVGAAVLVNRPSSATKEIIYLCGPQLITEAEQWNIIQKVSGQKIQVIRQSPEEYSQDAIERGFPPPLVNYAVEWMMKKTENETLYPESAYEAFTTNIKKHSGYEPTTFEEYVRTQKLS